MMIGELLLTDHICSPTKYQGQSYAVWLKHSQEGLALLVEFQYNWPTVKLET